MPNFKVLVAMVTAPGVRHTHIQTHKQTHTQTNNSAMTEDISITFLRIL